MTAATTSAIAHPTTDRRPCLSAFNAIIVGRRVTRGPPSRPLTSHWDAAETTCPVASQHQPVTSLPLVLQLTHVNPPSPPTRSDSTATICFADLCAEHLQWSLHAGHFTATNTASPVHHTIHLWTVRGLRTMGDTHHRTGQKQVLAAQQLAIQLHGLTRLLLRFICSFGICCA